MPTRMQKQEETSELFSDSGDQDSMTSVEPSSRNTTTGIYGDSTVLFSEKDSSSETVSAKRKRNGKRNNSRNQSRRNSSSDSQKSGSSRGNKFKIPARPVDKEMENKLRKLELQKISDREEMKKLKKQIDQLRISIDKKKSKAVVNIENVKEPAENPLDTNNQPEMNYEDPSEAGGISQSGDIHKGMSTSQSGVTQSLDQISQSGVNQNQNLDQISQSGVYQNLDQISQSE